MFLGAMAAKKIAEKIPWKWILIGVATLVLVAGVFYTVHCYNAAIREAQEAKQKLKAVQGELDLEQAKSARLQQDLADLKIYYTARESRQEKAATRRSQVLSRKEKTDEKGNIAADDPTLTDLNRLFPGDQNGDDTSDNSDSPSLPADAPGQVRPGG